MSVRPTTEATHATANTTTATLAVMRVCLATEGRRADGSLVAAGPSATIGAGSGVAAGLGLYRSVASAPVPLTGRCASSLGTGGGTMLRLRVVFGLGGEVLARALRATKTVLSSASLSDCPADLALGGLG